MHDWKKFLIDNNADIKRLDYVIRYSSIPSGYKENVSSHSFWVTLHSCLLNRELCSEYNPTIELKILLKALVHDAPEAVCGDLVLPFKKSNPELEKVIEESEKMMVEKFFPVALKNLMNDANKVTNEEDHKYETAIVKAADWISVFHYMNREYNRGNREITPFLNKAKLNMQTMATKVNDGTWYGKELSDLYYTMGAFIGCQEENREV